MHIPLYLYIYINIYICIYIYIYIYIYVENLQYNKLIYKLMYRNYTIIQKLHKNESQLIKKMSESYLYHGIQYAEIIKHFS